jgi:FdhD protein
MPITSLKRFPVVRHHGAEAGEWTEETVGVAVEGPLTIDIEGVDSYTVLCSPGDKRAMAIGFMFSEGLIEGVSGIALLADCVDSKDVMRVRLAGPPRERGRGPARNLLVVSSCGMCGSTDIRERIAALPVVGRTLTVDLGIVDKVMSTLNERQDVYKESRGTHGILIFDGSGGAVSSAEDIGRHNALDKAVGKILLAGKSPKGCGALLSGRVSFEMVSKCSRAGIELILAQSSPTSLALEAAEACGISMLASLRHDGAMIYTHPERFSGLGGNPSSRE